MNFTSMPVNTATINGVDYREVNGVYIPFKDNDILNPLTRHYGVLHYSYLKMAHPDQVERLKQEGLLQPYLLRVDRMAEKNEHARVDALDVPDLDDPDFDEEYREYVRMANTIRAGIEQRYVLCSVNEKILNNVRKYYRPVKVVIAPVSHKQN